MMTYEKRNTRKRGTITPAAIEIFREALDLEARGEDDGERYNEIRWALNHELQLPPWHELVLDAGEEPEGYHNDTWPAAQQMRKELEAAIAEDSQ